MESLPAVLHLIYAQKIALKPFCLVILKLHVGIYTLIFKAKTLIFDYDYDHRLVGHVQMHFTTI